MIINGFYDRFKPPLIAHVSTFPPTHCGIATYCSNLIENLHHKKCKFNPLLIQVKFNKYPISDHLDRIPLFQNDKRSYFQVLDLINKLPVDCVSLQHEFKLFGGKHGKNVLLLLKDLNKPLITTLHTISPNFTGKQRKIFKQIVKRSNAIIVLSNSAARILMKYYNVPISKINVIPHGVPNLPFVYPSKSNMRSKMKYEIIFLSAGFLREKKGIEYAFQALAMLKPSFSNFMYFILGENHPRQDSASNYRSYLQRLAKKLNLEDNVTFIDQYLSIEEMIKISKKSFFPGKETCHFCHFNPQAGNIAPNQCDTCHINLADIQPKNHNFNWMSKHAVFSKADAESCESCHAPVYCQDCHKRRDLPTLKMHDRNFRFIHGIEARANPRECGSCHQVTFCDTCHIKGGYDY